MNNSLSALYVGDLHPEVTESMLVEEFSSAGHVHSVRVCRKWNNSVSLNYAFVNFYKQADAERALATLNCKLLMGWPMRVMWSQRDSTLRKSGVGNLFIRNLDMTTIDSMALFDLFSVFGNVLSCKVVAYKTGTKGYGYVQFESPEAANVAKERLDSKLFNDHKVPVRSARLKGTATLSSTCNQLKLQMWWRNQLQLWKRNQLKFQLWKKKTAPAKALAVEERPGQEEKPGQGSAVEEKPARAQVPVVEEKPAPAKAPAVEERPGQEEKPGQGSAVEEKPARAQVPAVEEKPASSQVQTLVKVPSASVLSRPLSLKLPASIAHIWCSFSITSSYLNFHTLTVRYCWYMLVHGGRCYRSCVSRYVPSHRHSINGCAFLPKAHRGFPPDPAVVHSMLLLLIPHSALRSY
ncbi:poly(A) binding protein, cytoplasmic 1a [Silurus meridionalis]|nr:poly(A) binding protein, cytoplasmic 1a [Silurus meridionalis]